VGAHTAQGTRKVEEGDGGEEKQWRAKKSANAAFGGQWWKGRRDNWVDGVSLNYKPMKSAVV
jgi:hypothetical protein